MFCLNNLFVNILCFKYIELFFFIRILIDLGGEREIRGKKRMNFGIVIFEVIYNK